jgi:hypothetical protein
MKRKILHRLLLLLLAVLFSTKIQANDTYYYKASATSNNTNLGKVFLSTASVTPAEGDYVDRSELSTTSTSSTTPTVYGYTKAVSDDVDFYAQWKKSSTILATSHIGEEVSLKLAASSKTESSPTANNLTVYFMKVIAESNNVNQGTVTVTTPNVLGTKITLKATPKEQYVFLGWKKNNENTYESTSASWSFKVTEMAKYTAYFREVIGTEDKNKGTAAITSRGAQLTIKATANHADGYIFSYWQNGDQQINENPYTFTPGDDDLYVAHFKKVAASENTEYGTAYVESENAVDNATLKANAFPLSGHIFKGWSLNGNEEIFSIENPITIPDIGNDVYTARFELPEILPLPYYRVQNTYYNNYMSMIDDKADTDATTASFLDLHAIIFKDSYEDVVSDPGSIFYITNASGNEYDLGAQGVTLHGITGKYIELDPYVTNGLAAYKTGLTIMFTSGVLQENPKGYLDAGTGSGSTIFWGYYIIPVDKNTDNYFGVNAKLEFGGKYYTTLYAAFPFKLPEDNSIRAYYIKAVNDGVATCTEITDVVPGGTAVFLECNNSSPSDNRLELIDPSDSRNKKIEGNMMSGTYFNSAGRYYENGSSSSTTYVDYENHVANNRDKMRVLSKNSAGEMGFFKLSSSVEYMAANKAWLEIPTNEQAKSTFSIIFEDGGATGISEIRTLDTEDVSGGYYYDLQGRRVEKPSRGLYIHNGKKVLIK